MVRTIADLTLRAAPDPHSEKVLEKIPNGSQVMIIEQCQVWMGSGRGAQDADNLWCKVIYGTYAFYQGWANAYYLAVSDGRRLACVRYPRAQGCPPR